MSIEKVRAYFASLGIADRIREFTVSSATVELAAAALGCDGAHIAKTMSFMTPEGAILVVAAGDARIDNHKYKETFHVKAKMLSADEVEPLVWHPVGGVCPFVPSDGVRVYLDASLRRFDTVYPACGSPSSAIGLTIPELEKYAAPPAAWVDVCKIPE
ncbi:MAG: YbaK/EbsC family protein [Clostridiales bacterium]|nr:YbaK/EbsC family protein [Clostridiales bacterium]